MAGELAVMETELQAPPQLPIVASTAGQKFPLIPRCIAMALRYNRRPDPDNPGRFTHGHKFCIKVETVEIQDGKGGSLVYWELDDQLADEQLEPGALDLDASPSIRVLVVGPSDNPAMTGWNYNTSCPPTGIRKLPEVIFATVISKVSWKEFRETTNHGAPYVSQRLAYALGIFTMPENQANVEDLNFWCRARLHCQLEGYVDQRQLFEPKKPRVKANEKCPCGSDKKYKKCCGKP